MKNITKNTIISEVGFFPELNDQYREEFPIGKIEDQTEDSALFIYLLNINLI